MSRYTDAKGRGFNVVERRRGWVFGRFDGQTYLCRFTPDFFAEHFTPEPELTLFGAVG